LHRGTDGEEQSSPVTVTLGDIADQLPIGARSITMKGAQVVDAAAGGEHRPTLSPNAPPITGRKSVYPTRLKLMGEAV